MITFTRPDGDGHGVGSSFHPADASPGSAAASVRSRTHDEAGAVLAELYGYLREQTPAHPALATVLPVLGDAVAQHRAGRTADPYDGARAVLAAIEAVRRSDATIPEP
ncbi:hypothetical protein GC089_08640 [Cellulomonas sp. JZ18]|uniref:hypothetical protein n=1 Tax=Cellulomonas sp. JZ18 TaxID=2654191 RepID=UPI0012D38290|nr:hypothetical protein [Cellulomonas sp. JZ18]QGQ19286.1 hypothetical protein GC089_08640 [Cellulomonas sp. JZ18]